MGRRLPGTIDLPSLEAQLVAQDDALRDRCTKATENGEPFVMEAALLEAQCAIHERLGNLIILLLQNTH